MDTCCHCHLHYTHYDREINIQHSQYFEVQFIEYDYRIISRIMKFRRGMLFRKLYWNNVPT